MLNMSDLAMFNFLACNMDWHYHKTFRPFGNATFPLHLNHGRSFGRPFRDKTSCLAPAELPERTLF
jgi:extracellular serine/threonine protein kinase FAM20C